MEGVADEAQRCSVLTAEDLYYFHEGTHCRLYRKLGAKIHTHDGSEGVVFTVWAPNARAVSVMGDFNGWDNARHGLQAGEGGLWSGFVGGVRPGAIYKFHITGPEGTTTNKADPFAFRQQSPPSTGSVVWNFDYAWNDASWMSRRAKVQQLGSPISIYEVHLGSWMRVPEEGNRWLTYREIAPRLAQYAKQLGFTHVEFLPLMEHPFYGSWGYQISGYYAPTARYGTPEDLMFLIDTLHQQGLGVILDWVPSHFPDDEHGLAAFDGLPLYEEAESHLAGRSEWNSYRFNYARPEVRSFLLSNAMYWLDCYHADGLRVDALRSMLMRAPEQIPGQVNDEAVGIVKQLTDAVRREYPDTQIIAEESDAWPKVSRPTAEGGLGFGFKWDMGFAHDMLGYLHRHPFLRKHHHTELTFRRLYAYTENFIMPLSHDEMSSGKGSLLEQMPGDDWQKFANLRLLLTYQYLQPGKKLLFMGAEFGQWNEWNHETSLDWHLVQEGNWHNGVQKLVGMLNGLYRTEPALHQFDADPAGFDWIDCNDAEQSTLSWVRQNDEQCILCVCNFLPVPRHNFRLGAPRGGVWREIFNSDAREYGGSGQGNMGEVDAAPFSLHGRPHMLTMTLPPLGAVVLKPMG